ncbi:hypothetical protein JL720_12181 [Aureococcus anophagefferens]|nr:hypothetical protein JL720_12181 [Aureococcus anophagefferens]
MTARGLLLLATWARAEWCAVQIANVFGDAPLSVEWRLDAAPDVVAAAAAAVVDELPASAWPAAVEAAVRSTMAAHRANGCAGSPAPRSLGARGGAVDTAPLGAPAVEGYDASVRLGTTGFDHNEAWLVHLVLAAKAPLCAAAGADISRLAFNRHAFAFGAGYDGVLEVAPT